MARVFADITPLRVSAPYRRLWLGLSISNIGQQITAVAVGLQIYDMTKSSLMVGLVGLAQVIPLVGFGLYGGTLSDAFDRRRVGIATAIGLWACSVMFLAQSLLDLNSVGVLYLIIAVQSGFFAVGAPARQSIIPRLVSRDLLPAANALGTMSWNIGFTIGPLVAGGLVAATGTIAAPYLVDAIAFTILVWSMWRLPSLPPTPDASGQVTRAGWHAVREGLEFIKGKRNLQMILYEDLAAMVFGMPRALFPAIAALWYGGSTEQVALTLGLLSAAPGVGGVLSSLFSGPIGAVRFQGRAIVISIIIWGVAITTFGVTRTLVLALVFLGIAGGADNISAILRNTMLQAAVPDDFRGRMQGVNTVVIAGGPRLGDVEAGVVASLGGEAFSVISGGIACTVIAIGLAAKFPSFWRYDAQVPTP